MNYPALERYQRASLKSCSIKDAYNAQQKCGVCEFWLRDELHTFAVCKSSNQRMAFMIRELKLTKHLLGTKYFLWKPVTKEIEVR